MESKTRILLVGGTVLRQHLDEGCFDGWDIAKSYFGMSPLSLGESPRAQNVPKERLTLPLRYDANHDFKGFLKHNPADYIFVDIQKLVADLMRVDGRYCTYRVDVDDAFYTEHATDVVCVTDGRYKDFYRLFDSYTDMIRALYAPDRIVLLTARVPHYYLTGVRVSGHNNRFAFNGWYRHFEDRFVRRTGCIYYRKSAYYLNEKRPGLPVRYAVFEDAYYRAAQEDFGHILRGEPYLTEPDYAWRVERYARFWDILDRKPLKAFLSDKDEVDRFLLCCPGELALRCKDDLVALKALSHRERKRCDSEAARLLRAYQRIVKKRFSREDIELLLDSGVRCPELLDHIRAGSGLDYPKQITYQNYADFYHGRLSAEALPIPVDVIGCCVSRFIFNFAEDDFCINHYAFHYMPVMTDVPAKYNRKLFKKNSWEHTMLKLQADCGLKGFLQDGRAAWAVVDIFPLIELTSFMLGDKPIGAAGRFGAEHGFEPVKIYERYDDAWICAELKKYADLLLSLYGENIILVASRRQIYKINDEGQVVRFTNPEANEPRNAAVCRYEQYFSDYTGCWYVDIVDQFCSHDRSFTSLSPVHYEDDCYLEEAAIIRRIIRERPAERRQNRCREDVRIRRIIRLLEAGNSPEQLRSACSGDADAELLALPLEALKKRLCDKKPDECVLVDK